MKTYSEKLKDPRWQRKRLEIMQRDNFTCTQCGDKTDTQNVHHWQYSKEPWDAKNEDLTTVCRSCHQEIEKCKDLAKDFLKQSDFRMLLEQIERLLKIREVKVIAFDDCVTVVLADDALSAFDRLIDAAEDIDYSVPLPLIEGCSNLRYDAPLPAGIYKSDLPNMASHCKQELCGSCYHEGVFVQWDEDHDERVLGFIESIPPDIRKSLIVIQEHKAILGLIWKNEVPIQYQEGGDLSAPDGDVWYIGSSWGLVCTK